LDVEVYDGDETAKFVFWDNTLDDLIGMNAATLLEKEKKVVVLFNNFLFNLSLQILLTIISVSKNILLTFI
jgi:hypothetical protein